MKIRMMKARLTHLALLVATMLPLAFAAGRFLGFSDGPFPK